MPFNIKTSGIVAIGAFVLSLLVGLVSGGSFLMVLLRAGLMGAGFFVLITCAQLLINQFLPELAFGESTAPAGAAPGSMLDISVDDTSGNGDDNLAALLADVGVDTGKSDGADSETPDMPAMDQDEAIEYTDYRGSKDHPDDLPDLAASDDTQDRKSEDRPAFNKKHDDADNPGKNYNPQDLAAAITTMLKR
jgi:hypothetical protein